MGEMLSIFFLFFSFCCVARSKHICAHAAIPDCLVNTFLIVYSVGDPHCVFRDLAVSSVSVKCQCHLNMVCHLNDEALIFDAKNWQKRVVGWDFHLIMR